MVHNTSRLIKLPMGGHTLMARNQRVAGQGMGSVLLSTGGPGGASSYADLDDYISTTGIDPYNRQTSKGSKGFGMNSVASKLKSLSIIPTAGRRKNITMSM